MLLCANRAGQRLAGSVSDKGRANRLQPATRRRQKRVRAQMGVEILCTNCGEQGNSRSAWSRSRSRWRRAQIALILFALALLFVDGL
ncbi:hypothetical protein [Pandoravirus japonicus]|uniref:Uncharacterized protein n=1 Tax=Pandoravirus japonicus TaxID=2823154 RepID=A0A811BM73_9VIRU|nr:hypothetical protein [Pandoravirus japonicus]